MEVMDGLSKRFSAILESGRQSHAYIIEGGSPEARREAALELASMLLCQNRDRPTNRPCGLCIGCRKMAQGLHPDLVTVSPHKGMIRIDAIKEVVAQLRFPPLEAQSRAILIFDADRMNPDAANTLLKTLEEPPKGNCFFLVVSSQGSLLPTIRSRCQVLTLRTHKGSLYEMEKDGDQRFLELLEELELEEPGPEKLQWALETRAHLLEALALYHLEGKRAKAVSAALSLSKEISKDKDLFGLLFFILKTLARDTLAIISGGDREDVVDLLINHASATLLGHIAQRLDEEEVIQHLLRLEKLENMTRRGINLEYASNSILLFWFSEHE